MNHCLAAALAVPVLIPDYAALKKIKLKHALILAPEPVEWGAMTAAAREETIGKKLQGSFSFLAIKIWGIRDRKKGEEKKARKVAH